MLFYILHCFILLCLIGSISVVVLTMIINGYTYVKFIINSKGLPICDGYSIISGHINSVMYANHMIHKVNKWADKYGKTFGWFYSRQPAVFTLDLDLIKRVIVDDKNINRGPLNIPIEEAEVDDILTARDDQWRRLRKAFAPALRGKIFKTANVENELDRSIKKLISAIETELNDSDNEQIELHVDDLMHRFAFDVVMNCFYKLENEVNFDMKKTDYLTHAADEGTYSLMWNPVLRLSYMFPIIKRIVDWLMWHFHKQGTIRKHVKSSIIAQTQLNLRARKEFEERVSRGENVDRNEFRLRDGTKFSRNMIDYVIDQYHDGKLTKQEYINSSVFLIAAADKTVADSLVHTMYQIAINPTVQDKLRQSINVAGIESEYLAWVLYESLRLLPAATIGCSRLTDKDVEWGKYVVPAGTLVVTPVYSIHRLKEYWGDDAEEFKPERFADTSNFHPFQYIPFGAGPRGCPGKEFAGHEMKRMLCALVTRYRFECKPMHNLYNTPLSSFILPDKQTYVKFSRL